MIRRGLLRGLAGAIAVSPLVRAKAAIPAEQILTEQMVPSAGMVVGSDASQAKWRAFELLTKPHRRAVRRQHLARALCGGWPPGIAVMESNALWFRAAAAARQIEQREHEAEDWTTRAHRDIFGDT